MTPQISTSTRITLDVPGNQIHEAPTTLTPNMKSLNTMLDIAPAGLPHSVKGSLVWSGPNLANDKGYTFILSAQDVAEVEKALESFKQLGLDGDEITVSNFSLPTLGTKLQECARSLYDGMGFAVIRGLDSAKYSDEDNLMIYLGISGYIADVRGVQDKKGNMLVHVTDSKKWSKVPLALRHGIHQPGTLSFHSDMPAEILALQVRQCAEEGGATCVSSVWTAYNELMLCHPEELQALATPNWPIQVSGKQHRFMYAPLVQVVDGKVFACLDASRLGSHPTSEPGRVPNLSPTQVRALSALMEVASRHQLRIESKAGDLIFVNNFAMLHARERYKDGETTSRHIVRMWLRNTSLGWTIPDSMNSAWMTAFQPRKTFTELYPVVPSPDYEIPKYTSGSAAFIVEDSSSDEIEEVFPGPST
ncbi:hypothetical protein MKZ38_009227 [Zalerion maritima]|uniref:TauD/TfdA-like domain-containing protein n=1 Tax=Zalerion maritima TaxID=339359 RepID=A0AAD5RTG6_9PEZI|nr:hypothetical protein MKZ38_009227 [Zalerion maritima]